MRTIILSIYCNTRYLQYNILQYSFTPIQYIGIVIWTNTIYCIVRTANTIYCIVTTNQYNILYCQDKAIQYIVNNILQYNIYCAHPLWSWDTVVLVQCCTSSTPVTPNSRCFCTYPSVLCYLQYIVQYIAILVNDNTIYWYCKMNQYNILYCQVGPIQYIVLSDQTNTIYCIARSNQYNILLTIYCSML
jgi:hypothetical protein